MAVEESPLNFLTGMLIDHDVHVMQMANQCHGKYHMISLLTNDFP